MKLLPQTIPSLNGLSLAASNVSAERVGGDYYDFLMIDEDRLCLVIGDVSGKGASAAFYMAVMQGIFQSLARLAPRPIEFLKHANAALSSSWRGAKSGSALRCANLFHGQNNWQSSHP